MKTSGFRTTRAPNTSDMLIANAASTHPTQRSLEEFVLSEWLCSGTLDAKKIPQIVAMKTMATQFPVVPICPFKRPSYTYHDCVRRPSERQLFGETVVIDAAH